MLNAKTLVKDQKHSISYDVTTEQYRATYYTHLTVVSVLKADNSHPANMRGILHTSEDRTLSSANNGKAQLVFKNPTKMSRLIKGSCSTNCETQPTVATSSQHTNFNKDHTFSRSPLQHRVCACPFKIPIQK